MTKHNKTARHSKHRSKAHRSKVHRSKSHQSKGRKSKTLKKHNRNRKGGGALAALKTALVPFLLFKAQKHMQRRRRTKHNKKK